MVKSTLVSVILLFILRGQDIQSFNTNNNNMSIFDPVFQVQNEEKYGITSDEYMHYIIPQQFIVGFNETIISHGNTMKRYIHAILKSGGFTNATALWYYQTPKFVGVTIAGVDDALYTVLELDPNVVFIEPVRETNVLFISKSSISVSDALVYSTMTRTRL
jgi:hypothetical protein